MQKIILATYVLTTSLALVILKLGASEGPPLNLIEGKPHFNINLYTISGVILFGLSFVAYTYLISKYDLGYIIPVAAAFTYILIFTASYFIFKEAFTITKIIGIALIIGGLIFLNLKK